MKNTIVVDLSGRKIEVKKLPLSKYAELVKAVKELPKHIDKFKNLDSNEALKVLPELIGESLPDFVEILAIATPLSVEEINELGLDDAIELTLAVVEVNNYQKIYDRLKKLQAHPAPPTA